MTAAVCYLERARGGSTIRRVRLIAPGLDERWSAPVPVEPQPDSDSSLGAAALRDTHSAAAWVGDLLTARRLSSLTVCVDPDGASCLWLNAPSHDPGVIAATVAQVNVAGDLDPDQAGGGLLRLVSDGIGSDRSIQPLSAETDDAPPAAEAPTEIKVFGLTLRRGTTPASTAAAPPRRRVGLLSVPDVPVRIFLDELDRFGIEVRTVASLWHAITAAWDGEPHSPSGAQAQRVAVSQSDCSAVVLVDPTGRLVWSWNTAGRLIAAGSMRLRMLPVIPVRNGHASASVPASDEARPSDGEDAPTGARRLEDPASQDDKPPAAIVFGQAEVGRVISDWLAWSAQLGASPSRIVCIAPPAAVVAPASPQPPDHPAFESIAEGIAHGWPGATIDAAINPDPIGSTLSRLANATDDAIAPSAGISALTNRSGRVHRQLFRWGAGALAALALVIAAFGYQFALAARKGRANLNQLQSELVSALRSVEDVAPGLAEQRDPVGQLRAARGVVEDRFSRIDREPPIAHELIRFLQAAGINGAIKLDELSFTSGVGGSARLTLPENDVNSGPILTQFLRSIPGAIDWSGSTAVGTPGQRASKWQLQGIWTSDAMRRPGTAGGSGGVR